MFGIDELTGTLYVKDGQTQNIAGNWQGNAVGSPDNHLVGNYQFLVRFTDGSVDHNGFLNDGVIEQAFKLSVVEDNTKITNFNAIDVVASPHPTFTITEAQSLSVDAKAVDEYFIDNSPADGKDDYNAPSVPPALDRNAALTGTDHYDKDYYILEVDWNNDGSVEIAKDGTGLSGGVQGGEHRTVGALEGAPLYFDTASGVFTWTPNDVDVTTGAGATHRFIVTHFDGHGSQDVQDFLVHVDNKPPIWVTPGPADNPVPWALIEDTPGAYAHTNIQLDEEQGHQGLTYSLHMVLMNGGTEVTGSAHDFSGPIQLNGTQGGAVAFNTTTGRIDWTPTNSDVTDSGYHWNFEITGTDTHGASSTTKIVTVTVSNTDTSIEPVGSNPPSDPIGPQFVNEDVNFHLDVEARDEHDPTSHLANSESFDHNPTPNRTAWWQDAFYDLKVDGQSIYGSNDANGDGIGDGYNPNTVMYFLTPNTGGGQISFNKDTGEINWTPNDLDTPITASTRVYNFEVIHHDGHGDEASDTFPVTVSNTPPVILTPVTNPYTWTGNWKLVEDDPTNHVGETNRWTLDIETNDEHQGGVTYGLSYKVGSSGLGGGYTPVTVDAFGHGTLNLNGLALGGTLQFDSHSGVMSWETTNADVNYRTDGTTALIANQKYWFQVTATDDHNPDATSSAFTFETRVVNVKPEIDQVVYTEPDTINPSQMNTITWSIPATAPNPVATALETEDTHFQINFHSNDEEIQSSAYTRDAYYTVAMHKVGTTAYDYTFDLAHLGPYAPIQAGGGLVSGGVMSYNKDLGTIDWTPNNRDVGTWQFTFTHNDGQFGSDQARFDVVVANKAPELNMPTTWVLREYPTDANDDQVVHPVAANDWQIPDASVWSTDENQGMSYSFAFGTAANVIAPSADGKVHYTPNVEGGEIIFDPKDGIHSMADHQCGRDPG